MYAIQENELNQLRDLTAFLDLEFNFFKQAVDVLSEVKDSWHDESVVPLPSSPLPTHALAEPA